MTLNIERATTQDAPEIRRVLEEANLPAEDVSLAAPQVFFVLRRGSEIPGVAGVELYGAAALLRSVRVVDSAAGAGLGARLCDAAEAHARAAGASEIYLLTTTAAGYFARRGYRPVDRASAPAPIASSAQFRDLCPASAVCMMRAL